MNEPGRDAFDADDPGAQEHPVERATADEVVSEIEAFFTELTAPRLMRDAR